MVTEGCCAEMGLQVLVESPVGCIVGAAAILQVIVTITCRCVIRPHRGGQVRWTSAPRAPEGNISDIPGPGKDLSDIIFILHIRTFPGRLIAPSKVRSVDAAGMSLSLVTAHGALLSEVLYRTESCTTKRHQKKQMTTSALLHLLLK